MVGSVATAFLLKTITWTSFFSSTAECFPEKWKKEASQKKM